MAAALSSVSPTDPVAAEASLRLLALLTAEGSFLFVISDDISC